MTNGEVGVPLLPTLESRDKTCLEEFDRYYKERDEWVKALLDSERRYDTLLSAICTLALGATLMRDFQNRAGGLGAVLLLLAFFAFAVCLGASVAHLYWTYYTHKALIKLVDDEFDAWKPNALRRANEKYDSIPFIKHVEKLKLVAGIAVGAGLFFSFVYGIAMLSAGPPPPPPGLTINLPALPPAIVYVTSPTTLPSTRPVQP